MTNKPLTRRDFIHLAGRYGGTAFTAITALGLISKASGQGVVLSDRPKLSSGKKVLILGAGVAGMTAAYELAKLGIDSVIFEASKRAGGRCITIRKGDVVEETTGVKQVCEFDDGEFFDPGPVRFPQWHVTMDYCRELKIPIQPFVGLNENAYYLSTKEGGLKNKRVRIREAKADLRGYTAELLAKVADQAALDQPLDAADKEKLMAFLRYEGGLDKSNKYVGHSRRGYEVWPSGGLEEGKLGEKLAFKDLLQSDLGMLFHRANEFQYQSAMFSPVGGMDNIAKALERETKDKIIYGAKVKEFRKTPTGAKVIYTKDGVDTEVTGDFLICTIPPPVLKRIPNDFAAPVKNVINIVPFQNSGKIGLQFKNRFWENDDRIFGGVSWTNLPNGEIWYPNQGYFKPKGVLTGYYVFGPVSDQLGRMAPAERTEFALANGEQIHPQYRGAFDNAVSYNWATIPNIEGCLAHFPQAMIKTFYPMLVKPDGNFYIAADWASHLGGWQAGAFEAARLAVDSIYKRSVA